MTVLLLPNLAHADELLLQALKRRFGTGADYPSRSGGPGIPLTELIDDDGSYGAAPQTRHFGKVTARVARLVSELNIHSTHSLRPEGLTPKSVYVVDIVHPVVEGGRTGYLAVTLGGPPVLMPLPELPPALISGVGTVNDTRLALRAFAIQLAELVNLALPAARVIRGAPGLASVAEQLEGAVEVRALT